MGMSGRSVGKVQVDMSDCAPTGGDSPEVELCSKVPIGKEGSLLDMVVEEGVLNQHKPDLGEVLVVAEDIPSWLLLLSGATHGSLSCVCARGKNNWFVRDSGLEAKCSYLKRSELGSWFLQTKGQRRTILVQAASQAFGRQVLELVNKNFLVGKDSLLFASSVAHLRRLSFSNPWHLSWHCVSHADVGGVSSEKFILGAVSRDPKKTNPSQCRTSSVRRFVSGIQKVDISGRTCAAPGDLSSAGDSQLLTGTLPHNSNVHVAAQCLLEPFRLVSVFDTSTGWVARKLTGKEVAAAWDVPPDKIKRLESDLAVGHTTLRQLLSSPPLKILQGAFSLLQPAVKVNNSAESIKTLSPGDPSFKLSTYVPEVILKELSASHVKAVKNDDAATETEMWDTACVPNFISEVHTPAFEYLRAFSVKRFVKNVKSSFSRYLMQRYRYAWKEGDTGSDVSDVELRRDLESGLDGIRRAEQSSFWNWDGGSTPFFWRWQPEVHGDMRDGTKLYVDKSKLPAFKKAQQLPKDKTVVQRITEKIQKVRLRGYIAAGLVLSLTSFFQVPKGEDDIRIVYDLTACGLNDALWAPSFWMPTIMNVLDCATSDAWFGDVDAGEMFLNYILDVNIRPYAGVDVSWINGAGVVSRTWERWTRMAMGMTPSPFVTIRLFAWAMEIIKGDRLDKNNPFYWSEVRLNCPGSPDYDPSMPRVYKWNDVLGCIAADCVTFVDDLRTIGFTRALVQRATHRVETIMGYLGLQDATRKRRPNSRNPGEWTGSKSVSIPGTGLFVTVSQKKWDKARQIIAELLEHFSDSDSLPKLELKDLERKVGFLVHLAMAYPLMLPFLRGFYLTMNSWRVGRDAAGWKLPAGAYAAMMAEMRGAGTWSAPSFKNTRGPTFVTASPLLFGQLSALSKLFESSEPTLRLIRGASIYEACYVFGDASGEGFGSSWVDKKGTISFRYGIWGVEGDGSSSNYRELRNLVETLERLGELGELVGREVFLFTDNAVSESVAAKGSSASPKLYDLVVRLYRLEMKYLCKIEMIHVAGTRMIEQGTDGLSRGDMYEGVMAGDSMLTHVPLHLSALERSPKLDKWIASWALSGSDHKLEVLTPSGWFERGHDFWGSRFNIDGYWMPGYKPGVFLWTPPPGAARIAIEQLRQARLKRQKSMHIFVVPRLMATEWRRQVLKGSDFRFELPVGHPLWPADMHEPLMIALSFPYLTRQPWELRKTDLMVDLGREVQRVLKEDPTAGWNLLSQLCNLTREMDAMPLLRLRRVLRGRWRS